MGSGGYRKLIAMGGGWLLAAGCASDDTSATNGGSSSDTTGAHETTGTDSDPGPDSAESSSTTSQDDSGTTTADESSSDSESSSEGSSSGETTSESSTDDGTTGHELCGDEDVGSVLPVSVIGDAVGDEWVGSCGGAGTQDHAVQWVAPDAGRFVFATRWPGTDPEFDTLLYVLDGCEGDELACDDNTGSFDFSALALELAADQPLTIVVDGADVGGAGGFELVVLAAPPPGPGGSCCEDAFNVPGCDVPAVEDCVCAFDDYCCDAGWDGQCVGEALLCAAQCE